MSANRHFAFPVSGPTFGNEVAAYTTLRNDSDASPISSSNTSTYSSSRKSRSALKLVKAVASPIGGLFDKVAAQDRAGQGLARHHIQY
ncbi:hypothetical protein M409DRAFT_28939 [Zasmidium cellare ATCC 36951]|uniref:Uncharacterized protein n=1 Tax=Zasmidium cellare ATCC 36951 TaxID=1080233 RepID=A0A6A6C0R0_ZASCE|nr:uncharacterized protein M409DRAFT_28939 [Zasmidium cellare ATCC 36951]KAF2160555.1 hypothetical protein M409DRAFT_28939 [Zasmidium cellare ATCC 36951]